MRSLTWWDIGVSVEIFKVSISALVWPSRYEAFLRKGHKKLQETYDGGVAAHIGGGAGDSFWGMLRSPLTLDMFIGCGGCTTKVRYFR